MQGYALIEYESFDEAQAAIKAMDGTELVTQIINVDWAFSSGPVKRRNVRRRYIYIYIFDIMKCIRLFICVELLVRASSYTSSI